MFITTAYQGPDGVPPVAEPLMTTPLVCATRFGRTQNSTLSRATHKSCNAVSARRCASARLVQPLVLMRRAAGDLHAEAVDGRLCRWNNELIYEISLLRRDGHIVRVLFNAANGKAVERR